MRKRLPTWGARSSFEYSGSVAKGTGIWYGRKPYRQEISADQYAALLRHFAGATVDIGASFHRVPAGSVGEWLQASVTKTAMASYVGSILLEERYADRVPGEPSKIRFVRRAPQVTLRECYSDVVLFALMRGRMDTWWKAAVIVVAYRLLLVQILVPALHHSLVPKAGVYAALEDWPGLLLAATVFPFVAGFYLWQVPAFHSTVGHLRERQAVRIPTKKLHDWKQTHTDMFRNRRVHILSWIAAVLFNYYHALTLVGMEQPTWSTVSPLFFWGVRFPVNAILWYVILMVLTRQVVIIWAVYDLFRSGEPRVNPFHPDRCGGMSPLGDYFVKFSFFMFSCLLGLGLISTTAWAARFPVTDPAFLGVWIAYLVLAPVVLLLPLTPAHAPLKRAKRSSQVCISIRLAERSDAVRRKLRDGQTGEDAIIEHDVKALDNISQLYELSESMWVLPIRAVNVGGVITTILAPMTGVVILEIARQLLGS